MFSGRFANKAIHIIPEDRIRGNIAKALLLQLCHEPRVVNAVRMKFRDDRVDVLQPFQIATEKLLFAAFDIQFE